MCIRDSFGSMYIRQFQHNAINFGKHIRSWWNNVPGTGYSFAACQKNLQPYESSLDHPSFLCRNKFSAIIGMCYFHINIEIMFGFFNKISPVSSVGINTLYTRKCNHVRWIDSNLRQSITGVQYLSVWRGGVSPPQIVNVFQMQSSDISQQNSMLKSGLHKESGFGKSRFLYGVVVLFLE